MQYEIRIDVTDPAGNTRSKTVTSATVGKLEKPIITIEEKNQGEKHEEWYTGTVIITIKDPVEENTTGATGISYTIAKITNTGSNLKVLSGTPEGRETKIEFTSAEGEIKVTANMVGLNGGGPIETKTFKRDVTAPDTPSITVGEKTENTIKVTARSSDTISGLASYKFEYSTSSSGPWKTPTNTDKGFKSTLNQNTCDYEYEGLEASTTYYFRVTVTDNAGWSSSNDGKINETTEEAGITPTESMIGKTVAGYNPKLNTTTGTKGGTTNSSGYTPDSQYAGTSSSEPFTTENLGWRIWGLDSNNIYLISATATSATLRLSGAQGYNNGVYILNEICRTCYTDSNYSGVSVRSMNIRDIEELYDKGIMTYNYRSYNEYGASLFSINYPWPTTWTNWDRSTGIPFMSRSIQPNLIESNSQTQPTSYSNPISSYWGHTFADQEGYTNFSDTYLGEVYPNMIFGPPKNLSVDPSFVYWLASRSVNPQSTATCYFQMCKVGGCGVDSATMWFYGKGAQQIRSGMNSVRPIVTIPLTNCKITKSTDGKTDYNISARH